MKTLIHKAQQANADLLKQLADLIVFAGYFSACLYVGGLAYILTFNDFFGFHILQNDGLFETSLLFAGGILGSVWQMAGAALFLFLVAVAFFAFRFLFQVWFGYVCCLVAFCTGLVICAAVGNSQGENAAKQAILKDGSRLPSFKQDTGLFAGGSHRLLHETATHVYVIEPVGHADSLVRIHALLKNKLANYEMTIK